jgi:hypothetical protein
MSRKLILIGFIFVCLNYCAIWAAEPIFLDTVRLIEPRKALLYAAICPGLGQIYVKKPLKAALVISAEGYHFYQFARYKKIYNYVKDTQTQIGIDVWTGLSEAQKKDSVMHYTGYRLAINTWRAREKRNKYGWWCAAIYLIGILDAYVDAHLYYFPHSKVELSLNPMIFTDKKAYLACNLSWRL